MKTVIRCYGISMMLFVIILAASCSKEKSSQTTEAQTDILQTRVSGVIDDDSALQAKVPLIASSAFIKIGSIPDDVPISRIAAKGRRDATPPIISFTSPTNNVAVSGTINITVLAKDNIAVASVSLSVDGTVKSTSTTSPFTNTWNSGTVPNGVHTLTVMAKDAAGNKTSSSIQVSVNNVAPGDVTAPTINLASPGDGAAYDANTTIKINSLASDNVGVTSVNISIDGTVVGTTSGSSHSYSWNTSTAASGIHTISSTARDAAGNQSIKSVNISINTVVVEPPTASGVQLIMPPVGNQVSEGSCVAFAVGYAARSAEQYYRSGASSYSNATNIFSPEFLYNQIKATYDCNSGSAMLTALDFMTLNGICTYQSMPYNSSNGCSLLPNLEQSTEALTYKIDGYTKLYIADRDAIKAMIEQKHPVIVTILADNSFIGAKAGFVWKTYSGSGSIPHCVVICGYDDSKSAYKIMNSWGTGWGDAGYSWIDYDFFTTRTGTYGLVIN